MSNSSEKSDFQSLLSYLKFIVTVTMVCIGLIVGAFTFFIWGNGKQMKDEISEIKEETKEKITGIGELAENEIQKIKLQVEKEAIKEVEKYFRKSDIQRMISEKTEDQINRNAAKIIKDQVASTVKSLNNEYTEFGEVIRKTGMMANNNPRGLYELFEISKNAKYEINRERAQKSLIEIGDELMGRVSYMESIEKMENENPNYEITKKDIEDFLFYTSVQNIANGERLTNHIHNFSSLNAKIGERFKIYELDKFEKWCSNWLRNNK